MSLTVLCPTRGRPGKAREAYDSFYATKSEAVTRLILLLDDDDPALPGYVELVKDVPGLGWETFDNHSGMGVSLNRGAQLWAEKTDVVGFIGDDHRFRTDGWDVEIEEALAENGGGFAFGNDLARNDIPTQVFVSSKIIRALGWMALPGCTHLYLDNAWAVLGNEASCLFYFPELIIEHMHPFGGKGEMDDGYRRVNAPAVYQHDLEIFQAWMANEMRADVGRVQEALG